MKTAKTLSPVRIDLVIFSLSFQHATQPLRQMVVRDFEPTAVNASIKPLEQDDLTIRMTM